MAYDQRQESYPRPAPDHDHQQEQEREAYPFQYPTYPSQYTSYNAEFISPSVTPAPYTAEPSICSTPPPPVPSAFPPPANWDHGSSSEYYSTRRDVEPVEDDAIYSRPLPALPVSAAAEPSVPQSRSNIAELGKHVQHKGSVTVLDVEKEPVAPTPGGAFVTVFGRRYNKKPVIIVSVIIVLVVVIIIALGAGLGSKDRTNKSEPSNSLKTIEDTDSTNDLPPNPTQHSPPKTDKNDDSSPDTSEDPNTEEKNEKEDDSDETHDHTGGDNGDDNDEDSKNTSTTDFDPNSEEKEENEGQKPHIFRPCANCLRG